MKKIIKNISFIFSILLFLILASSTQAAANLEIDFENMNGHAIVKMDEGAKEVVKIKVINAKGNLDYEISGGADKDLFSFDKTNLVLSFKKVADFENPKDSNLDNVYRVSIMISDSEKEMRQSFWVYIEDVELRKNNQIKKEGIGVRGKRHAEVCKDTKALNFQSRGQHNQSLCIYEIVIEEKKNVLAGITSTNSENKETNTVINKKTYPKKTVVAKKTNNETTLAEALLKAANPETTNTELADSGERLEAESQMAAIGDSDSAKETVKDGSSWYFWAFIILLAIAAWLIWKVLKKDDQIDIDRL